MSVLLLGRGALVVLALLAARRARGPRGMAVAGVAGAAGALGPGPVPLPDPVAMGAGLLVATFLLALLGASVLSPLTSEAGRATAALAVGATAIALVAFRGGGLEEALLGGGAVGAALSLYGAEGCRANAEAGWRRGLSWASAVVLPALVGAGLVALGSALSRPQRAAAIATAFVASLLAWVVPLLLERRRIVRELTEEALLGILPNEDLAVLGNPWRRTREARLGRADERREYVRSALLLAVARQQQRRRTGEAIRLRQLEVLAFRTRVRRVVEGRRSRYSVPSDEPAF
jgi:hypothetical protein